MHLPRLMKEFAKAANVDHIPHEEDGSYRLEIDGMLVTLSEVAHKEDLFMWAEVGALPPEGRETLCHTLLTADFMGQATQGAVLSIDPDTETITLHRIDSFKGMDFEHFKTKLEHFVNVLETWRKTLEDYRPIAHHHEEAIIDAAHAAHQHSIGNFIRV